MTKASPRPCPMCDTRRYPGRVFIANEDTGKCIACGATLPDRSRECWAKEKAWALVDMMRRQLHLYRQSTDTGLTNRKEILNLLEESVKNLRSLDEALQLEQMLD